MTEYLGGECASSVVSVEESRADPDSHPRFDSEFRFDVDRENGEVLVSVGLSKSECEELYDKLGREGHEYPENVREAVLSALGLDE